MNDDPMRHYSDAADCSTNCPVCDLEGDLNSERLMVAKLRTKLGNVEQLCEEWAVATNFALNLASSHVVKALRADSTPERAS